MVYMQLLLEELQEKLGGELSLIENELGETQHILEMENEVILFFSENGFFSLNGEMGRIHDGVAEGDFIEGWYVCTAWQDHCLIICSESLTGVLQVFADLKG